MHFMAWGCFLGNGLDTANAGQTVSLMPTLALGGTPGQEKLTKWQREQMSPVIGKREMYLGKQ